MLNKIIEKMVHGFSFGMGMGISILILPRNNIYNYENEKKNIDKTSK